MTRSTVTNSTGTTLMDMQYIFPAPVNNVGVNNGRVSQTIDGVLGETVNNHIRRAEPPHCRHRH